MRFFILPRLDLTPDLFPDRRAGSGPLDPTAYRRPSQNEASWVKLLFVRKIRDKFRKRSQISYPLLFQCVMAKKGSFFEKNGCFGRDANDNWGFSARQRFSPKLSWNVI